MNDEGMHTSWLYIRALGQACKSRISSSGGRGHPNTSQIDKREQIVPRRRPHHLHLPIP